MSFFDDASLAFLPSGAAGKDGKAYSIKPTDGTGDFTFSRGSNLSATRIGPDGLIEKGRENLLLQSNQFDTTWVKTNASVTSGQSGYDGSSNAWLLSVSGGTSSQRIEQSIVNAGVQTFSVYAKKGASNFIRLRVNATTNAESYFDLENGVLGTSSSSSIDAKIESVGNGWYRCSIVFNSTSSLARIYPAEANGDVSHTSGSIYIQDSQLEVGLAATEPIESGASTGKAGLLEDEPRFDYSGGATCPSLLLEPSRTNLITQSEYIAGLGIASNATLSLESETNPSGSGFAYKVTATEASSRVQESIGTQGNNFVFSGFFKGSGTATRIRFRNNQGEGVFYNIDANGAFTLYSENAVNDNYGVEDYGNGWHRIFFETTTSNSSVNYVQVYCDVLDGDGSVLVWGLQAEQASYASSYIPNHSGGSVTRGADFPTTTISTDITDSTQGSVYFEFQSISATSTGVQNYITLNNSTIDNIRFGVSNTGGIFRAKKDSSDLFSHNFSISDPTAVNKMAFRWGLNDWKLYLNGSVVYTSTTMATFESGDLLKLENGINNGLGFLGNVKQLLVFPTKLSNAELATLTTL